MNADSPEMLSEALTHSNSIPPKFQALSQSLVSLISDFGLLSFEPLCIDDPDSVLLLAKLVDKANGFVMSGLSSGNEGIFETVMGMKEYVSPREIQEKYWGDQEDEDVLVDDIEEQFYQEL
jgi:hypothetical protein